MCLVETDFQNGVLLSYYQYLLKTDMPTQSTTWYCYCFEVGMRSATIFFFFFICSKKSKVRKNREQGKLHLSDDVNYF